MAECFLCIKPRVAAFHGICHILALTKASAGGKAMQLRMILAAALICAISVYAAAPKGTVPRASADSYPAHTVHDGLSVGATLLTSDQVRKAFISDLNRCCLVVEVALYPEKDGSVQV